MNFRSGGTTYHLVRVLPMGSCAQVRPAVSKSVNPSLRIVQITYICIVRFRKNTKDITIQWTIVLVQRGFTPTSGVETPLSTLACVNFGHEKPGKIRTLRG